MKSPPFSEEADYPDEFVPHASLNYLPFFCKSGLTSVFSYRPPTCSILTLGIGWNLTCRSNQLQYWRQIYPFRCLGLCHVPNCPACRVLAICEIPSPVHELRLPVVDLAIDPYETDTLQKDSTEGESESVDQELPLRPRKIRNTFWPIRAFYSLVQLSVTITSTCPWLIFRLLDGMLSKIFDSIEDYDNSTDNRK